MNKLIFANWKISLNYTQTISLVKEMVEMDCSNLIVFPSLLFASEVAQMLQNSNVSLGAQDCASKDTDALTGGIGVGQLNDINCKYCLIGHSERRIFLNESPKILHDKLALLLKYDIIPVLCIGEDHISKKSGVTEEVVMTQLDEISFGIQWDKVIVAYEPVWAIGTGVMPSPEEISEVADLIRSKVKPLKILYGGSVNSANIQELFMIKNIDGFLIGSASTKLEEISKILKICN